MGVIALSLGLLSNIYIREPTHVEDVKAKNV
jgi:hypothetical protein